MAIKLSLAIQKMHFKRRRFDIVRFVRKSKSRELKDSFYALRIPLNYNKKYCFEIPVRKLHKGSYWSLYCSKGLSGSYL